MSKIKTNELPKNIDGPFVVGQASSVSESGPIRDLPTPQPRVQQEPREINPQNTIPVKTMKKKKPSRRR